MWVRSPSHSTRSVEGSSLPKRKEAAHVILDRLGERRLRRPVEPLPHRKGQAQRSIGGSGANRGKLGKAHQQGADQADGIGILDACSRVHDYRLFFRGSIPTRRDGPQGAGSVRRGPKVSPRPRLEKTPVTLRKVPGALALGLLASLMAHGGLYGGEHAVGGNYHGLLLQAAFAGAVGLFGFFALLALRAARGRAVTGSVLAARLTERLPGYGMLCIAATAWYATAECLEPHHAAASWLAVPLLLGRGRIWFALLSRGALAVSGRRDPRHLSLGFCRAHAVLVSRGPRSSPAGAPRRCATRRRFARPPPIEFGCA